MGNLRWPPSLPSWKSIFHFFSWNKGRLSWNFIGSIVVTSRSKQLKSFWSEIQESRHGCHLEIHFFASSPEPSGQLTQNLVGSIRITCWWKRAKTVPIRNPRWPPWPLSWKSILDSSPEPNLSSNQVSDTGNLVRLLLISESLLTNSDKELFLYKKNWLRQNFVIVFIQKIRSIY